MWLVSRTIHHFPHMASHGKEDGVTWLSNGSQRMRVHSPHLGNVLKVDTVEYRNVDAYDYKVQAHYSERGIVWEVYERTADGWEKRKRGYDKRVSRARERAHAVIVRFAEVRYGAGYRVSRLVPLKYPMCWGVFVERTACRNLK